MTDGDRRAANATGVAGERRSARAQQAWDTLHRRTVRGIPTWSVHVMEHRMIDRLAGVPEGSYVRAPEATYHRMMQRMGVCLLDQYLPRNALTLGSRGFEGDPARGATTGSASIVVDGRRIDSPEAVVEHLESVAYPAWRAELEAARRGGTAWEDQQVQRLLDQERARQAALGPDILKAPYGCAVFPALAYTTYGYEYYLMAYALYPEVMERGFALRADVAVRRNAAVARACREGGLPPILRLDHDMADSRGTLVDTRSLDRIWFPHFARAIAPLVKAGIRLLWHCDGNLMAMVPRLLECGLQGFQGFQYEDGMDYEAIGRMRTRDGDSLILVAGVSVTRTLPRGTPDDVRRELAWLVRQGPPTGLFLAASSSITPGVPWNNLEALVEGLAYYREHGRK